MKEKDRRSLLNFLTQDEYNDIINVCASLPYITMEVFSSGTNVFGRVQFSFEKKCFYDCSCLMRFDFRCIAKYILDNSTTGSGFSLRVKLNLVLKNLRLSFQNMSSFLVD